MNIEIRERIHYPSLDVLSSQARPRFTMDSPHEYQQSLLLTRIITNVVSGLSGPQFSWYAYVIQEKLNEAVMVLNKNLQVWVF